MSTNPKHRLQWPIELPALSDEAVIQIRNFIEHVLDQFDTRYFTQLRRYYEDRAQHNMAPPVPHADRDPPF